MKKRNMIYAFLLVLMAFAVSCKKDAEVNKDTFKIENEKVTPSTQSVMITGSYAYSGAIDGITLELGRQTDLMDADAYRTLIEDTDFSVEVKNLRTNTTYYYRYAVEYGGKTPYYTDIKSFKTQEYNLPEVKSIEVVSVGVNRAEVGGEVLGDGGGDAVTLRGICWSMSHNPSVGDEYANAGEGIGTFTCELTNLQPEKTYYARAFAGNSKGVSYGEELTFVTLAAGSLAEVKTIGITGNANLQATVNGEVTSEGTSSVIERGVCYGKEHYPTTSGLHVSAGTGAGAFNCQLMNLEANVTYFVRAYAINSLGIAYGEEMGFVAQSEMTAPVVLTGMVSDITVSSATGHGTVVSDGGATVTRRGLCWSTEHNPTVEGTHADCGNGVGEFSGMMSRLTDLTTYYVRAYAENAIGLAYGEEVSFTVGQHEHAVPPTVVTGLVTDINPTTAVGHCEVTSDGGSEVTERGLCWGTSQNPTIEGSHAHNGTGTGNYTVMMTGLQPETAYYVRAYARNSVGTNYGNQVNFTTSQVPQYTVSVSSDPSEGGTVSGGGTYQQGQSCTLTATANSGYYFTNWTENGSVVSTDANYTFVVNGNLTLVANFVAQAPNTYTINVSANPTNGGMVSGGGTYQQGQLCTVVAQTNSVSTFTEDFEGGLHNWTVIDADGDGHNWFYSMTHPVHDQTGKGHNGTDGFAISASYQDGVAGAFNANNYLVAPEMYRIQEGSTLNFWADYGSDSYPDYFEVCVATAEEPTAADFMMVWGGTAKANNTTKANNRLNALRVNNWRSHSVDLSAYAGQSVWIAFHHQAYDMYEVYIDDVELVANNNFTFVNWTENGNEVSADPNYTFTVNSDRNLVANFELQTPNSYTISVSANPGNGGTVSGGGTYQQGQNCTLTATANSGYYFTNWTENGSVVSTNANYSFTVNAARTLVANFTAYSADDFIDSFESGDFSRFNWQLDSNYPWTITTNDPFEGIYCMKSGCDGVPGGLSSMTVTVTIPADGTMSFYCKISCETFDRAYFYIDGEQKDSYTGNSGWSEKTFDITAGEHVFQWRYAKDASINGGDDCIYIDRVSFYKMP